MRLDNAYANREQLKDDDGVKVWLEELDEVEDGKERAFVHVRSSRYAPFSKLQRKLGFPERKKILRGTHSDTKLEKIQAKCVSRQGLVTWGGIYDGDTLIPFSAAAAEKYFLKYPTFLDDVVGFMGEESIFFAETLEKEKNSSPAGSPGSASGESTGPTSSTPSGKP